MKTVDDKDAALAPIDATAITLCDQEPIHIPGSIQPHGLMLVVHPADLRVVAGAGELEARLAEDWHGRPLAELAGDGVAAAARAATDGSLALGPVHGREETFDVLVHQSDGLLLVELEPAAASPPSAASVLAAMDRAGGAFERAADLKALCERAVMVFRDLTGFDRVMIYRFLEDEAGAVLAEDKAPELHSFLNHHFPASDIPRQARALYIRNRVRVIPDVDYRARPIRPASANLSHLDLSDVALRSVSPIHIQYLKNMGVRASASISIVKDGVLWGLVACHHYTPRGLTYDVRAACATLAGGLARQIRAKDEAETYRERLRLRSAEDAVLTRLASDGPIADVFEATHQDLRAMLGADGFALVHGKILKTSGRHPSAAQLRALAAWVQDRAIAEPFSTRSLAAHLPVARAYADTAAGLLAVVVSTEVPIILMWFRAERVEVVNWAGNPHKGVAADPQAILTPRNSFEAWSETVAGRSKAWTLGEVDAANRLRRSLFEGRQNARLRELNRQLGATIADNESLIRQKDYLLREVNHRVQNSLQLVSAFLGLQVRALGDATAAQHLVEAQRRIAAVGLVHRRLYGDEGVETVELSRYIEALCAELIDSLGPEWEARLTLDLSPMLISGDRAVNIGLVLNELVINASKYAYGGAPGPVAISLEQHQNRLRLIVADQGAGKVREGKGFGSRMIGALLGRVGGEIDYADNRPGLRAVVTALIEEPRD